MVSMICPGALLPARSTSACVAADSDCAGTLAKGLPGGRSESNVKLGRDFLGGASFLALPASSSLSPSLLSPAACCCCCVLGSAVGVGAGVRDLNPVGQGIWLAGGGAEGQAGEGVFEGAVAAAAVASEAGRPEMDTIVCVEVPCT